jgi:hypothetical protein
VHRMRHGGRLRGQRAADVASDSSPGLADSQAHARGHDRRYVRRGARLNSGRQRLHAAKPACRCADPARRDSHRDSLAERTSKGRGLPGSALPQH